MNLKSPLLLKALAIYEVLGGLWLLYLIFSKISIITSSYLFLIFGIFSLLSVLSVVAGVMLWQGNQKGINLSSFVQATQLLIVTIPGVISWYFYLGAILSLVVDITSAKFNFLVSYGSVFNVALGNAVQGSMLIGINFIPLLILFYLSKQKLKKHLK